MTSHSNAVILLGPPGVGKGTQGALLEQATGWTRIATGDLLRQACAAGTQLGIQAQEFMDAGQLVPDEVIVGLVKELLASFASSAGVIFDGFPRTVPQAEELARVLDSLGRELGGVLLLEAPDDVLVRRISGRRVHPGSGRTYHVDFDPPQIDGQDDLTGEALVHRPDDQADTVQHRLEVYRELTEPLIAWYREAGARLSAIDADRPVADIQDALRERLGAMGPAAEAAP
jgi:adenylate kinase